jgi:hypothetical protein
MKYEYEIRVTSYELRVASYELRVASYELRVTSFELRVTSSEFRVTRYELGGTSNELQIRVINYENDLSGSADQYVCEFPSPLPPCHVTCLPLSPTPSQPGQPGDRWGWGRTILTLIF